MAEKSANRITGDDIISELVRNVDVGLFKVGHTVLLPCRFNVYLHEQDFDLIHPIADVVRSEAKQALREHLDDLNKVAPQRRLVKRLGLAKPQTKPEYKILENDWSVDFHRGEDDRMSPGEIEIYSDLGTQQRVELGAGAKTTFVTRHSVREHATPGNGGPDVGVPSSGVSTTGSPSVLSNTRSDSRRRVEAFAMLRYTDGDGEKVFAMTRDEIVLGRGGKAVWVDLKFDGPQDISREHCRIRRDPSSGTFFVKDLSQFGTAVNDRAIPTSIERGEHGDRVDRNVEVTLPSPAKITLADVLVIEFKAAESEAKQQE